MRGMCNTNHIFFVTCPCSLQFASDCADMVEHKVLPYAVDPFTAGREGAANKITTTCLTRTEASDHLVLHGHCDHCISSVAHHKVLWVFRKQDHTVDHGICPCSAAQGFKSVWTFCRLHIPDLYSAIRECTNIRSILCKSFFINKGGMAAKFLQGSPRF